MSLLALLSYKNKQKKSLKVDVSSFDIILKDYNFDNNQDDDLDNLTSFLNQKVEPVEQLLKTEDKPNIQVISIINHDVDISNNSDVEEDSPFNDSENEN